MTTRRRVPLLLGGGGALVVGLLALLHSRASARQNHVALASEPKGVSVVAVVASEYRPSHRYIGRIEPWLQARVGPQLLSGYVETVLVRPGDVVLRGAVLATLSCQVASSSSAAVAAQARALQERQRALASETTRIEQLSEGGFVAANELDQKQAGLRAASAQVDALQAQLTGKALEVQDCTLRAPFAGEIGERTMDPGSFARPGTTLVSVVDRHLLRVVADAPETDAAGLEAHTKVSLHLLASDATLEATVSRRAPSADPITRTVHFEIDLDPDVAKVPVGTTAEIHAQVGVSKPVSQIPLTAAKVRGKTAAVFILEGDVVHARSVDVVGERGGLLFLARTLEPGTLVVNEGRSKLSEGDRVHVKAEQP